MVRNRLALTVAPARITRMSVPRRSAISRQTAGTLYLAIGIIGALLVVGSVVLIVVDSSFLSPYFTAIAGACLVVAAFVARRVLRRAPDA